MTDQHHEDAVIRFRLDGPSRDYDPARQAIRPDLADVAEAHRHFAPHYAEPCPAAANRATPVLASNSADADVRAELAAGARFAVLDHTGDWAWGYTEPGHQVGYVLADHLDYVAACG